MTMAATITDGANARAALTGLLRNYSAEVTARDKKGIDAAPDLLPKGAEVFVANLPNDDFDKLVAACAQIRKSGLTPVPHMVARNTHSTAELDEVFARLVGEAGLDRALILGGDRDHPVGELDSALQILKTGLIQKHGIGNIFISCYPEGHPRIADEVLEDARAAKLAAAAEAGLHVTLVSQFCFDAGAVIALTRRMRALGQTAPYRVGVAGPADRGKLIKFALMCGVGASLRALKERQELSKAMMTGETPEALLTEVAEAQAADPSLGLEGVHFFTFGDLPGSVKFAEGCKR